MFDSFSPSLTNNDFETKLSSYGRVNLRIAIGNFGLVLFFFLLVASGEKNNVIYDSIYIFQKDRFDDVANLEHVILQEKLDGCNFRLIFDYETGHVSFGSRTSLLTQDFRGFYRIRDSLIEKVKKIAALEKLDGKTFIIFGELIGYNSKGKRLMPRYQYDIEGKKLKFFAYDILIVDRNNTRVDEDTGEVFGLKYENFFEVQDWLKRCDFDVVPFEVVKAEDYSYSRLLKFKSILFNHEDIYRIEGYIVRVKFKNLDTYKVWKLKPTLVPELNMTTKMYSPPWTKLSRKLKADDKFLDYLSKVPYLDDDMKIKPEYIAVCLEEYQRETNAGTKEDFIELYKSLCGYCREKPNFTQLFDKFNEVVSQKNSSNFDNSFRSTTLSMTS